MRPISARLPAFGMWARRFALGYDGAMSTDPPPHRSAGKTGILEGEMIAAREDRRAAASRDAVRDAAQLEASQAREARWFRLAMAELFVIVAIAVVILGRSMTAEVPGVGVIDITGTTEPAE